MTYDPYRNATQPPREPYQNFERDPDGGTGTSFVLGAIVLLVLGGLVYFFAGDSDSNVATNEMRPPITQPGTTGSGGMERGATAPAKPAE